MPDKRKKQKKELTCGTSAADQNAGASEDIISRDQQQLSAPDSLARRAGMADVARRRAAHFANYADDEHIRGDSNDNIHVGGSEARRLGMWSSAMELVNAREQARQRREQIIKDSADVLIDEEHLAWTPAGQPSKKQRAASTIFSLFDIALHLIVEYIEDVESLWGIPDGVKCRIAAAVCYRRKLSPSVIRIFTEESPSELSLPDCTQIDVNSMAEALLACASTRLTKLSLGLCGRGMTDETAAKFAIACGGYPCADVLHLTGAYRLSDKGLLELLRNMPHLKELSLPQCSRLEGKFVESLPDLLPGLRSLDLGECRGIEASSIVSALAKLPELESVILDGLPELRDGLLACLTCCAQLQQISLCRCSELTDSGLASLAQALPGLKKIRLDDCTRVTSEGIISLAKSCLSLQHVSLRGLSKLEPAALVKLVERGTIQRLSLNGVVQVNAQVMSALAIYCKDSLQELDVSWCRKLSNEDLGYLADSCNSLRFLTLWGCSHLTDTFFMGHANSQLIIIGRGENLLPVPNV